jgi:choline kinase
MADNATVRVRHAIVLAAGNGDRFHNRSSRSKLLTPVAGKPLLLRTLAAARTAGITDAHLVLGYDADGVRELASSQVPSGLNLHFHLNRDWQRENGLSVLAARSSLDAQPFALMMGDHIFEADVLRKLLRFPRRPCEALLAVDTQSIDADFAEEATKVRLDDGRVTAIGKTLRPYDALDTGLFVCDRSVFDALEASCVDGDSTLSGGIGRLAARGLVRGVDIGRARWCDIDTLADLTIAEELVERASCV